MAHGVVCKVLLVTLLPGIGMADWRRLVVHNVGVNELVREGDAWWAVRMNVPPAELTAG